MYLIYTFCFSLNINTTGLGVNHEALIDIVLFFYHDLGNLVRKTLKSVILSDFKFSVRNRYKRIRKMEAVVNSHSRKISEIRVGCALYRVDIS